MGRIEAGWCPDDGLPPEVQNWADHLPMNVVKELMGHADISTTAEFYSTVTEEHEAKAQWIIEAITVGSRGKNDARAQS